MNKIFLKKMKETLLLQKREIISRSKKDSESIDTEGDEIDVIQGNILIELNNQLNSRNSTKLLQITEALKRMDDNSYGLCEDCNEAIAEKRLLLNPYFQTCISCAEEREMQDKQRKKL